MSGKEYLHWHDGVEFDDATQTWRGYIEDNNVRSNKHLTEQTFDDKGDAIVAASKMLSRPPRDIPRGRSSAEP